MHIICWLVLNKNFKVSPSLKIKIQQNFSYNTKLSLMKPQIFETIPYIQYDVRFTVAKQYMLLETESEHKE